MSLKAAGLCIVALGSTLCGMSATAARCNDPQFVPSSTFHNSEVRTFKDVTPPGAHSRALDLELRLPDKNVVDAKLDCTGFIKSLSATYKGECYLSLVEDLFGQCNYMAEAIYTWSGSDKPCFVFDEYHSEGTEPFETLQVGQCQIPELFIKKPPKK